MDCVQRKSFNLGGNVRTVSITVEPNGEAPICKGEEVGDDDAKTKSDEAEEEEEEEDDDDGEGVAVVAGNWQQRAGAFLDRNEIKFKANKNKHSFILRQQTYNSKRPSFCC